MIQTANDIFVLHTAHTTYAFRKLPTGQLEHLYYGRKIHVCEPLDENAVAPLIEKHTFQPGNSCVYDREHNAYTLEDLCLEMSAYGKGDIREPFVELVCEDGSFSSDFVYESSARFEGSEARDVEDALPASYDEKNQVEHLCVTLKDNNSALKLELHYYIYEDCDVITRSAKLINDGENAVQIRRLMSCQVDFPTSDHVFTSFHGAWAREMRRWDVPVAAGKYVNASYTGTSSSRANPFVMLSGRETTEDTGDCYGFNLVYSGNHYEAVEVNSYGKTRFVSGINPQNFDWKLDCGESFQTPEAVVVFSDKGLNGMSQTFHKLYQKRLARGYWRDRPRPILNNNWEATYFDFTEDRLVEIAAKAKECGVELFVLDDGWFGARSNDHAGLGDWVANRERLPRGIKGIADRIEEMGMKFGLWFEPEMVNKDSDLYRAHPDWILQTPQRHSCHGRNQYVLDFSRKEVVDCIYEMMYKILSEAKVSYIKWDMNRSITECCSSALPADRQGEVFHRYILGVYDLYERLNTAFPQILFESCASGGGRFDPGILYYAPQGWTSDDTDAAERVKIQYGTSMCYPVSSMGSHVSVVPNHQLNRKTPLHTRANVAYFGTFGYELDLNKLSDEEISEVKQQITFMKEYRELIQFGTFYRLKSPFEGNETVWMTVSEDKKTALVFWYRERNVVNADFTRVRLHGLDPDLIYRNEYNETENYGDELMNLGLLTTDCTAGEPTSEDEPCTDYESRIYVLTAK